MSSTEENSKSGLPGLPVIRKALRVLAKDLAEAVSRTPQWISDIERGSNDCTQSLQRNIAAFLGCGVTVVDLIAIPSKERLRQIRRAYHLREAESLKESGAA